MNTINKLLLFALLFILNFLILSSAQAEPTITTNFMWINVEPNKEVFIFPQERKKDNGKWDINIMDWVGKWVEANPKGKFVFWYDKNTVSAEQLRGTEAAFSAFLRPFLVAGGSLQLRDINELGTVKQNPAVFSREMPIYIRVDLLRIIAGLEVLSKCRGECIYIYADVDKGMTDKNTPLDLSENALLDSATKEGLKKYGLVLQFPQENNFLMMSNSNTNILKALKAIVVDANIIRAKNLLREFNGLKETLTDPALRAARLEKSFGHIPAFKSLPTETKSKFKDLMARGVQTIFASMTAGQLMAYFLQLEGKLKIRDIKGRPIPESDIPQIFSKMNALQHVAIDPIAKTLVTFDDLDATGEQFPSKVMKGSATASGSFGWPQ